MSLLSTALVDRLSRRGLDARWARTSALAGERGSKGVGAGIEFAEHDRYRPGDDLRHIDATAYARFRQPFVKRFVPDQGLDVAILLDQSASMAFGEPTKAQVARSLGAGLACLALAGGDRLRLGTFERDAVRWSPSFVGSARLRDAMAAIPTPEASGAADLTAIAAASARRLEGQGLLVVLSDWWTDRPLDAVKAFAATGRELVVIHVLSPEEEAPAARVEGDLVVEDAETGERFEVAFDAAAAARYRASIDRRRADLAEASRAAHARYLYVRSDVPIDDVLLRDWRAAGLVR